ncbi:hypothetical protein DFH11DRAFT_1630024 [Phellopilus nigrolimitatus]|nr:hypothetical protein DFH11DRAFT_1642980 [Phellopilus nigrolimitatus]KAH8108980.1 hypothetical protein DFH11DRAFT_1630024 [Phellopilus nigrolimitatus]
MALWAAGTVQVYYYYNMYPNDNWWFKSLVAGVWILDTIHQGLITHACYIYLVTQYANVPFLSLLEPSLNYMVLVSAFTCLPVQCYLVYRIWKLSCGNVFVVSAIMTTVIAEFVAVLAFFGRGVQYTTYKEVLTIWWLSVTVNSLTAASDVAVAAALIFYLNRARTGFQRSESAINRLIFFSINTGLVTSVSAIISVIFLCVFPSTLIYIAFYMAVSKLYANSLFTTLNSRNSTRENLNGENSTSGSNQFRLSALRPTRNGTKGRFVGTPDSQMGLNRLAIKVDTVTMDDTTEAKTHFDNEDRSGGHAYEDKGSLSDSQV